MDARIFSKNNFFIISVLLFLSIYSLSFSGSLTDDLRIECPDKYYTYHDTIQDYIVRMSDFVKKYGCGVIDVYALFVDDNIDLIEALEDDETLMKSASQIFMDLPELANAIENEPAILKTMVLMAKASETTFSLLTKVLSGMGNGELNRFARDSRYFLYPLAAIINADSEMDANNIRKKAREIQNKVHHSVIDAYILLSNTSIILYRNASAEERMRFVDLSLSTVGIETLRKIQKYKEYLVYFLPPDSSHIAESQNLSSYRLKEIQKNYIKLMKFIFKHFDIQDRPGWGLILAEVLSGYISDALRYHNNAEEIKRYLEYQFNSPILLNILGNSDPCDSDVNTQMSNFFSMYSPGDGNEILPDTAKGNLGLIAKWFSYQEGKAYMDRAQPEEWQDFVRTMFYLPKIRFDLSYKQVDVFQDLLLNLSDYPIKNGLFIISLKKNTNYFEWVGTKPDAEAIVRHNSDAILGGTVQKYKYIFLTSYPKDTDTSIINKFNNGEQIKASEIYRLMDMNRNELEEHNFTEKEKNQALAKNILDTTDNVIFVASILAVPLTAGASTATVAWCAARKGAKIAAKKAFKTLAKRAGKSTAQLFGKKGKKAAWRECKEILGVAAKRGRKNIREESMKKSICKIDSINNKVQISEIIAGVCAGFFLANSTNSSPPNPLCPETSEQSKQ